MDWADELVVKKINRQSTGNAEQLRQYVSQLCESNVKRWQGETWSTEDERVIAVEKETARLVQLLNDEEDNSQLEYEYAQKGIEIQANYSRQKGQIDKVRLPFTYEEWVDLFNFEGEYLPSSHSADRIRDILYKACQQNGFIEAADLSEAIFLMKNEDIEENDGPLSKMVSLWETVKLKMVWHPRNLKADVNTPEGALDIIAECADTFSWNRVFPQEENESMSLIRHANCAYALATVQAAVRTLFFKLKEMNTPAVEGFGIVHVDGTVLHTKMGLAIYRDMNLAQSICATWNRIEKKYSVQKIRVSMEKGVEYLPE